MKEHRLDPALIFAGVIGLAVVALGVFIVLQVRTDEFAGRADSGEPIPFLFTVTDNGIPIVSEVFIVHPKTKKIAMVDIPQNLGAIIGSLKRSDSYQVLYKERGLAEYKSSLSQLLGIDIPFYVQCDASQIVEFIDLLGGLPVFVADSIDVDQKGELTRIPNGNVVLDGEKSLSFIRYQGTAAHDLEDANRRWAFSKSVISQLGKNAVNLDKGSFSNYVHREFTGNLDDAAFRSLCKLLATVDVEGLFTQPIIGTTRTIEAQDGKKDLLFPHMEGQLLKVALQQVLKNLASQDQGNAGVVHTKVEILNGTTQKGLAKKTSDILQAYGIEIVQLGNASSTDIEHTQILDRRGNPTQADNVAKILKCNLVSTQIEGGSNRGVDVTVILGKDFDGWSVKN